MCFGCLHIYFAVNSAQCSGLFAYVHWGLQALFGLKGRRKETRKKKRGSGGGCASVEGLPFIYSAWFLHKIITHNNRISALFAWHIFPSGLWRVPPSVRSLKKCPRQTTLSTNATNTSCPLSKDVLGMHDWHIFSICWPLCNNSRRPPKSRPLADLIATTACWTSHFKMLSKGIQNVEY